jgi:hypothetical protein
VNLIADMFDLTVAMIVAKQNVVDDERHHKAENTQYGWVQQIVEEHDGYPYIA